MPQQAAPALSTPQPPTTNVPGSIPTFAELEAAGAVIGKIYINNQDIFDVDNPKEDGLVYRLANKLHNTTRPGVIRQSLLFNTGETVSVVGLSRPRADAHRLAAGRQRNSNAAQGD